jgi:hypothetical protein
MAVIIQIHFWPITFKILIFLARNQAKESFSFSVLLDMQVKWEKKSLQQGVKSKKQ